MFHVEQFWAVKTEPESQAIFLDVTRSEAVAFAAD
jgi:hypothetical protein